MAIPIFDLPSLGYNQTDFDLIVPRSVNRMEGRRTEARTFGTPYYVASYQIVPLAPERVGKADAWIRKVMSRNGVFRAYDVSRPRPVEAGLTPLTWTPDLISITNGGQTVAIAGVANNFQFREGDYVCFKMSDLVVSLHTTAEDVRSNGSGAVTLTIDPPLDTQHFTASAVPIFEKPYCLMQPFEWKATKPVFGTAPSFSAQEVFFYDPPADEDEEEEE